MLYPSSNISWQMICCTVSILIKKIDDMLWTCMHKSGHHCYPHKLIDHTTSPKVHLYPAPGVLKLLPTLWRPGNLWNSLFPKVDLDRFRTILYLQMFINVSQSHGFHNWKVGVSEKSPASPAPLPPQQYLLVQTLWRNVMNWENLWQETKDVKPRRITNRLNLTHILMRRWMHSVTFDSRVRDILPAWNQVAVAKTLPPLL